MGIKKAKNRIFEERDEVNISFLENYQLLQMS
jgi:hypothetical protein